MILKTIIRFGLLASILATSFLFVNLAQASTYVDADINTDTTWSVVGSPYIIDTNIYIASSATLTIEPGTTVKLDGGNSTYIYVAGAIKSLGLPGAPVYFTSYYDDTVAGEIDDYVDCYFLDYDEEGNGLGEEICDTYDTGDPSASDWGYIYFDHSSGNVLENTIFKYTKSGITFFSSSATITGTSFSEVFDALTIFNASHIDFDGLNISEVYDDPITVFNDSSFSGTGLSLGNIFTSRTDAIVVFNSSDLYLKEATFTLCPDEACITFFDANTDYYQANPTSIKVEDSVFNGGLGSAFLTFGSMPIITDIKNSVILGFAYFGIENYSATPVFAENNFWGDPSGPFHTTLNTTGAGELMYGPMDFDPWLKRDPRDVCKVNCFSNVLFLPGMQGSRLYEFVDGEEEERWYSRSDGDHERLFLDDDGKSINNIYTKDDTKNTGEDDETGLVDEASLGINIYESFIDKLREWKEGNVIVDYDFVPYDWRVALSQIVGGGEVVDGNVNFSEANGADYIIKKLEALAESSKSGKVSIVAHSYGGIVTKALLDKLNTEGSPLYGKIDKIIFVAVPQIGTPQSAVAVLHGTGIGKGLVMDKDISREFAEDMPTAYNLLPRESYFDSVEGGVVSFPDHKLFQREIEKYGEDIESASELYDYILGAEGREKPGKHKTDLPNIGNEKVYDDARATYGALDSWSAPADTKVIEVAGWGAETLSGLDYKVFTGFGGVKYTSYKLRHTIDGDGTVVAPSALWMPEGENTERWWVNLEKYNKTSFPDKDHAYILEVEQLLSFIESKIKNQNFSDAENIITQDTSTLTSGGKRLHYTLHSPLYLGVEDSEGRYTGRDPVTGELREEIPDVIYEEVGEVQWLSVPEDLAHTLKLHGYAKGVFALDVDEVLGDENIKSILFQTVHSAEGTEVRLVVPENSDIDSFKLELDKDSDGIFELIVSPWSEDAEKPTPPSSTSGGGGGGGSGFPFVPQVLASVAQDLPTLPIPPITNQAEDITVFTKPTGQVLGESIKSESSTEPVSEELGAKDNPVETSVPIPKNHNIIIIIIGGVVLVALALKYLFNIK